MMLRYSESRSTPVQLLSAVSLAIMVLATFGLVTTAKTAIQPEPFKLTNIHFETNADDCDIGIQMAFDTEGITEGSVSDPNGNPVYSLQSSAGMADIGGQSEGFLEGVEPQITELRQALGCEASTEESEILLGTLFDAWPSGTYDFAGTGGGLTFEGSANLTTHIPAGPKIIAPAEGARVFSADNTVLIRWQKVTGPIIPSLGPVQIVGYHVVVSQSGGEGTPQFDVDVSKGETSMTVPKQFLEPGNRYGFEVLATDKSGNQTLSAGFFCTTPMTNCQPE